MVQSNLQSVIANAEAAGVDILVVTWVFQNAEMHELVQGLAPAGSAIKRIQLLADEVPWRERFDADPARPSIDEFFLDRYSSAQDTPADHRIDTSQMSVAEAADCVADLLGL
jgi:hypothetical protein